MKRPYFLRIAGITLLCAFICMTACSTLKSLTPGVSRGDKSMLKKRVLVAPVINMAALSDQKAAQLTDSWLNQLKKDRSLSVTQLTGFKSAQSAVTSSSQGVIVDPELIKKAEEMGMNVLVTQVLEPLNYTAKKRGIWPFRKLKGEYDVSMVTNAVDIINGTLILSSRNTIIIKMGKVQEGQKTAPVLGEGTLNETIDDLQKDQSSTLLDSLAKLEWKGKIILDSSKIKINGGADIGITKGSVFEVFGRGDVIMSATGKEYYAQGMKIGEISVTDVNDNFSFAAPLGNKTIENGQIITIKSDK